MRSRTQIRGENKSAGSEVRADADIRFYEVDENALRDKIESMDKWQKGGPVASGVCSSHGTYLMGRIPKNGSLRAHTVRVS